MALLLYAASRHLEQGETPDIDAAWTAWRANAGLIALVGLMSVLAHTVWERTAAILFAVFDNGGGPMQGATARLPWPC